MKKNLFLLFILSIFIIGRVEAQGISILIYSENFENTAPGVLLNTTGNGTNTGNNMWVINNNYTGTPLYPNTPDQNQVSGGNISFAPNSNYLHIHDQASGITNCNYNTTNASDRFALLTNGFCTLGMTNVRFTFFYICEGSPTAYGEVVYSANNGPWTSTGSIYNNQMVWQYVILQNPAFDNVTNLKFGIRWVNDAGSPPGKMAFGIDDIFIVGDFDNFTTNFNVVLDSIKPNPICQNFGLSIYYHLPVFICGAGFFEIQLSDATGSFASPVSLGIYQASNQYVNGVLMPTIPANTPAGSCYKVRIKYYYTEYQLNFYSNSSVCLEILSCPNTVTTLQPVVTLGGDSVCVGSVIDVPFFSTGVFQSNNQYIAELSDSSGNFPANPNVLGSSPDPNTYDPNLPPGTPGSVSGMLNEDNQPIQDGCNYYIRVRSTNPATIGMVWGPFCIRHCDIETNDKMDIHACITSTQGFDTTVTIDINYYDSTAIYGPTNQFVIEVHESQFFGVVNTGGIGTVTANSDTTLTIHIPPVTGLGALGLQPGLFYIRIIATNSNHSFDVLGTLIRLIIGAPADDLEIWQTPADSVLCVGDAVYFYPIPYHSGPPWNSSYEWFLNGNHFSSDPAVGILFNGAGTFHLTVQETNYGCVGPLVPNNVTLYVLGPPNAGIIGPSQVCLGDTIYYHTIFNANIYYEWGWDSLGGTLVDTSNNELFIVFNTEGVWTIDLMTLNKCGSAQNHRNIIVTAHPDPQFTVTTPVCTGDASTINWVGITTPPVNFQWNWDGGVAVPGGNNSGPHNVTWTTAGTHPVVITVTKYNCPTKDTMFVDVLPGPVPAFTFDHQCSGTPIQFTNTSQGSPITCIWDYGDGSPADTSYNPVHTYQNGGTYWIQLALSTDNGCTDTLLQEFIVNSSPTADFYSKSPMCTGVNSTVTYQGTGSGSAVYTWDFGGGSIVSGEGQGPYEISWPGVGTYTISLVVSENGCASPIRYDSVIVQACEIVIPNIFTPNNDGSNDEFVIKGIESFPESKLEIFNRWGKKIYECVGYKSDWTGKNYADGVYYYVLTLENGESFSGTVTLMR